MPSTIGTLAWASSLNPLEPGLVQEMKDQYYNTIEGEYYFVEQNGTLVPVKRQTVTLGASGRPGRMRGQPE